jgi:hypothetical protein
MDLHTMASISERASFIWLGLTCAARLRCARNSRVHNSCTSLQRCASRSTVTLRSALRFGIKDVSRVAMICVTDKSHPYALNGAE